MPKFDIEVKETVWYNFEVEADTEEEAEEKARDAWWNTGPDAVEHSEWLRWRQDSEVDGEVDHFFAVERDKEPEDAWGFK